MTMDMAHALSPHFKLASLSSDYGYGHGRGPFPVTTLPDRFFENPTMAFDMGIAMGIAL